MRLRDSDVSVPLRFLDEYEECQTLDSSSYVAVDGISDMPAYGISILKGYCSLSIVMTTILETLYTENSITKDPYSLLEDSASVYQQLQSWFKGLPPVLTTRLQHTASSTVSPHAFSLR